MGVHEGGAVSVRGGVVHFLSQEARASGRMWVVQGQKEGGSLSSRGGQPVTEQRSDRGLDRAAAHSTG